LDGHPATRIGDYRLLRRLGAGGMGDVWLAEHTELKIERAVKLLPPFADAEAQLRFRREAEAMASLDHPHVARIHAFGESQGQPYLVLDLLRGGSLEDLLAKGPLAPAQAAAIARQLALGLEHMHQRGVLHRDIKPANVQFDERRQAQWIDFGLARPQDARSLTETGTIMGTPAYMAPEQAEGLHTQVDARSDVYGLGAVLYHCLTGRAPFRGASMLNVLSQVLSAPPTPVRELAPHAPAHLAALCERALAKSPGDRPASATAFLAALDTPGPTAVATSRRRLAWGGAGLLAVLGLGLVASWSRPRSPDSAPATNAPSPAATAPPPSASPRPTLPAGPRTRRVRTLRPDAGRHLLAAFDARGRLVVVGDAGVAVVYASLDDRAPRRIRLSQAREQAAPQALLATPGGFLAGADTWGYWVPEAGEAVEIPPFRSAALHPEGWPFLAGPQGCYRLPVLPGPEPTPDWLVREIPNAMPDPTAVGCDGQALYVAWGSPGAGDGELGAALISYDLSGREQRRLLLAGRLNELAQLAPGSWLGGSAVGQVVMDLPENNGFWPVGDADQGLLKSSLGGSVRGLAIVGDGESRVVYALSARGKAGVLHGWTYPQRERVLQYRLPSAPAGLAVSPRQDWLAAGSGPKGDVWLFPLRGDGRPAWKGD
jgi:serine/threonine protein kinase